MKRTLCLLSLVAPLLTAVPAEAAKFYKWTDEQGATHYSADPPPASANKAGEVRIKSRYVEEAPADQPAPAGGQAKPATATAGKPAKSAKEVTGEAAGKPAAASKGPEQYAEKCKQLRSNLQSMEEHARVKETDDKGEVKVLTDEEKTARLDNTQRQIKAFCE